MLGLSELGLSELINDMSVSDSENPPLGLPYEALAVIGDLISAMMKGLVPWKNCIAFNQPVEPFGS